MKTIVCVVIVWVLVGGKVTAQRTPTDTDISIAIESALIGDDYVPPSAVDVTTAEGVVTLSGSVDNVLAKERVVELAESLRGVRGVVDLLKVVAVRRSDAKIKADVVQALRDAPAVDGKDLHLEVTNGVVTVSGKLGSHAEKQLALEGVKAVRGVNEVKDDLVLWYGGVRPRSDADISAEVKRRLELNVQVYDQLIKVTVTNGVVRLSGEVKSLADKRRTVNDAWVAGVRKVVSESLTVAAWPGPRGQRVRPRSDKTDSVLAEDVRAVLQYDPRIKVPNVQVYARDGVVTLRGTVAGLPAKQAAEADARNTVGVWDVRNLLKVRPASSPSDAELTQRITQAFRRDPYLYESPVIIKVHNGVVRLTGMVDTIAEKIRADSVAGATPGVLEVRNFIDARPLTKWELRTPSYLHRNHPPLRVTVPLAGSEDFDDQLQDAVQSQLFWTPFVKADRVRVAVQDGVVTLTGTVESWLEYGAAQDSALQAGAKSVRNQLEVRRP